MRTEDPSGLMVSLSDNLLSVFLVANLLTGAVNIGMDTLAASDRKALGVVVAYVLAVWGFAAIMQRFRAAQVT